MYIKLCVGRTHGDMLSFAFPPPQFLLRTGLWLKVSLHWGQLVPPFLSTASAVMVSTVISNWFFWQVRTYWAAELVLVSHLTTNQTPKVRHWVLFCLNYLNAGGASVRHGVNVACVLCDFSRKPHISSYLLKLALTSSSQPVETSRAAKGWNSFIII